MYPPTEFIHSTGRLQHLWTLAQNCQSTCPQLAAYYITQLRQISYTEGFQLPSEFDNAYCYCCGAALLPGVTTVVDVLSSQQAGFVKRKRKPHKVKSARTTAPQPENLAKLAESSTTPLPLALKRPKVQPTGAKVLVPTTKFLERVEQEELSSGNRTFAQVSKALNSCRLTGYRNRQCLVESFARYHCQLCGTNSFIPAKLKPMRQSLPASGPKSLADMLPITRDAALPPPIANAKSSGPELKMPTTGPCRPPSAAPASQLAIATSAKTKRKKKQGKKPLAAQRGKHTAADISLRSFLEQQQQRSQTSIVKNDSSLRDFLKNL
ncbi:hypothetical protein H4R35_006799 [Dimargaris xerosporica]|nr:hypothetical protein H4R35_006799 [Dimargaris xerosporica]